MTYTADDRFLAIRDKANAEHVLAIGEVVMLWADFEALVDAATLLVSDLPPRRAACLTAQVSGSGRKLDAYIAIAGLRGADKRLLKELAKLATDAAGLAEQRNRVAHDPWIFTPGKIPERVQVTARKRAVLEFTPHDTQSIKRLGDNIAALEKRFMDIHQRALSVPAPWHDTDGQSSS